MIDIYDDPDILLLHDLSGGNVSLTVPLSPEGTDKALISAPEGLSDITNDNTQDEAFYVLYFQSMVTRTLVPDGLSAQAEGTDEHPRDVLVSISKACQLVGATTRISLNQQLLTKVIKATLRNMCYKHIDSSTQRSVSPFD